MATKRVLKRHHLNNIQDPSNGINAITIKDEDELLEAKLTNGNSQIMLAVESGKLLDLRKAKLDQWKKCFWCKREKLKDKNDQVVGMVSVNDMDANILVVSENGWKDPL